MKIQQQLLSKLGCLFQLPTSSWQFSFRWSRTSTSLKSWPSSTDPSGFNAKSEDDRLCCYCCSTNTLPWFVMSFSELSTSTLSPTLPTLILTPPARKKPALSSGPSAIVSNCAINESVGRLEKSSCFGAMNSRTVFSDWAACLFWKGDHLRTEECCC